MMTMPSGKVSLKTKANWGIRRQSSSVEERVRSWLRLILPPAMVTIIQSPFNPIETVPPSATMLVAKCRSLYALSVAPMRVMLKTNQPKITARVGAQAGSAEEISPRPRKHDLTGDERRTAMNKAARIMLKMEVGRPFWWKILYTAIRNCPLVDWQSQKTYHFHHLGSIPFLTLCYAKLQSLILTTPRSHISKTNAFIMTTKGISSNGGKKSPLYAPY
ncbi:hypothetical protein B0T14DRAFT_511535 [Immersiella caudata]|uniref:Uncharacterized protein n=1 Tax=Immersiella caudata TaxID=314043 RepID=A0AA39X482_9PEZI|nr:hypothetical protein B0T14DRAFT_511535 [Immersiella caudata]